MLPIGIITRDRPLYLDATLRSLSGSDLQGSPVWVFDDGSITKSGYVHLYRNYTHWVDVSNRWPSSPPELQIPLNPNQSVVQCLQGLINVERIGDDSLGVWNASNFALNFLAGKYPKAEGFLLLQDDVLLKPDWVQRILNVVWTAGDNCGIVAGVTVVHRQELPTGIHKVNNVTAQLLYVSRRFYGACVSFFARRVDNRTCYDSAICSQANENGFDIYLITPYIARHVGISSMVRQGHLWEYLRAVPDVSGPFAWAENVRCFL